MCPNQLLHKAFVPDQNSEEVSQSLTKESYHTLLPWPNDTEHKNLNYFMRALRAHESF